MTLMDWCPDVVTDHHEATLDEHATASFSGDRTYRYALTRRWDPDRPAAVFIMLNPSTADAFEQDPTIRRCIGFARTWRAGGILVLNLFALRATDPKALYRHPDPIGRDNDAVIAWHFSIDAEPPGPVIAAWGVHGSHRGRARHVTDLLRTRCVRLLSLGATKDGHPKHPLYLPNDSTAVEFPQPVGVAW